jgi:hypothetical protein
MGAAGLFGAHRVPAARATDFELDTASGAAFGILRQRGTAIGAQLLLAGRALIGAHLNHLPASRACEFEVARRRGATGSAMCVFRIELPQALGAKPGLTGGAGGEGGVPMSAAPGAGDEEGEGDPVTDNPRPADQGSVAAGAGIGGAKNGSTAGGAVAGEKGVTARAKRCARQELLVTHGAPKVEVEATRGTEVRLVVDGSAAGRADCLSAIGAEAIVDMERQAASGAAPGKSPLGLLLSEHSVFRGRFQLKAGTAMGAGCGLRGDLSVALATEEAIVCAASGTGRRCWIERRAAVDTERLTTAGAGVSADGELPGAHWALHRHGL